MGRTNGPTIAHRLQPLCERTLRRRGEDTMPHEVEQNPGHHAVGTTPLSRQKRQAAKHPYLKTNLNGHCNVGFSGRDSHHASAHLTHRQTPRAAGQLRGSALREIPVCGKPVPGFPIYPRRHLAHTNHPNPLRQREAHTVESRASQHLLLGGRPETILRHAVPPLLPTRGHPRERR